jgi:hypothetical protein
MLNYKYIIRVNSLIGDGIRSRSDKMAKNAVKLGSCSVSITFCLFVCFCGVKCMYVSSIF